MALAHQQIASMHSLGYATVTEVCEVLRIQFPSVYRKVKLGQLRGSRIGKATYVSLDSLDEYLRDSDAPPEIRADARRLRMRCKGKAAS